MTRARVLFCELYNRADERTGAPEWVREQVPHVSPNSLLNWKKAAKRGELGGKYGQHRRGTGVIDTTPQIRELITGLLYKYPDISIQNVMDALQARCAEMDVKLPSKRTVERWIRTYRTANASALEKVANPDGWRSKYMSASGSASADVVRLNQIWEYDSTVADVMLADGRRHAIIGIIDVWSRRVKFLVSRTSRTAAIKALTRRCILDWGVPEVAKTDNGADYVSKEFQRCLGWLGVQQDICPPFSPEKKPHVERVFKTFLHGVFELLDGYVGHNVVDRKAIESRKAFAQRLGKQGEVVELGITPQELQEFCDHWTDEMYAHREHGSIGMTPFAKATSYTGVIRKLDGDGERSLDVLLSPAASNDGYRDVRKKGLSIGGHYYDHPILRVESEVPGGRVRVLLDETDAGYAYCFAEDGRFVCRAKCPELLGISREQLARACKEAQRRYVAEATREMSAVAKREHVDSILGEIVTHTKRRAAGLSALPHRSEVHSTPEIAASLDAHAVTEAPAAQVSAEVTQRQEAMQRAFARRATVTELPRKSEFEREQEAKRERFERACALEATLDSGEQIADEDARWLAAYRQQPEYRAQRRQQEHMQQFQAGLGKVETKKEVPSAGLG